MTEQYLIRLKSLQVFTRFVAWGITGLGLLVLGGWLFAQKSLAGVAPDLMSMKANTALAFLLAGVGLWLLRAPGPPGLSWRCAPAGLVLLLGGLTLLEYLLGWNLRIDQLLSADQLADPEALYPGRMAPATALNFVLAGGALLLLDRRPGIAQSLSLPALVIATLALMGYLYGVRSLHQFQDYVSIAKLTSAAFMVLALGILTARPQAGLMKVFTSSTSAGLAARHLLPTIPIALITVGGFRLQGELLGYYDTRFGLAMMVLSSILFTSLLTIRLIRQMYKAELIAQAEQELHRSELERLNRLLEARVEERTHSLEASNQALRGVFEAAPVPMLLFRREAEEAVGQRKIRLVNSSLTQLLGFDAAALPDLEAWFERIYADPDARRAELARVSAWLAAGGSESLILSPELAIRAKDNQVHLCEVKASSFGDKLLMSLYDLTERKRIEEDLRASEALLRQYLDALPIGVSILGADGKLTYLNQWAQNLLSKPFAPLTPSEMLPDYGLYVRGSELSYPLEQLPGLRALQGLRTHLDDLEFRRPEGSVLVEAWGMPLYDAQGKIMAGISAMMDITRRLELEAELRASEATLRQYLDALPIGVSIMGPDYQLKYINQWAHHLLRKPFEAVAGDQLAAEYGIFVRGSDQLYPLDQMPSIRALKGERRTIDNIEVRLPDRAVPLAAWGTPVYDEDGRITAGIAAFIDISERLNAQMALEQALEAAQAASRAKGDFLANMSHEIRTPLNAIVGLNYLLLGTPLSEAQRDYVDNSQQAAKTLLGLINDVLDMSKIEAGKLELEAVVFELNQVLENLLNLLGRTAVAKGLELAIQVEPELPKAYLGDQMRLEQVLVNLVGNAIKFTERGEIRLEIELLEATQEELHLRFSVTDTGIGISESQASLLFQPFNQADGSTTRRYGGTGLGLSISRYLVTQMRGELTCHSVVGVGSTFSFDGWLGKAPNLQPAEDLPIFVNQRALIIDNNGLALETLRAYLMHFGLQTETWLAGRDALDSLKTRLAAPGYDLLLIERSLLASLPLTDLSSLPRPPHIILMSGRHVSETPQALEVGAYLEKPITPSRLYNALIELIHDFPKTDAAASEDVSGLLEAYRGSRLLLVEDNRINQRVASELLEAEGFVVDIANHGEEALACLSQRSYGLVLMDLQMPVMDGLAATREIRSRPQYRALPIVAMTADAVKGVREQVLQAGMNDYLTKPIELTALLKTLAHWLGQNPAAPPVAESPALVAAPASSEKPALDIGSALNRLSGNLDLYRELIAEFDAELRELVPDLEAALLQGHREKALYLAHRLKGAASTLGLTRFQHGLQGLEQALRGEQDTQAIWAGCQRALDAFRALLPLEL